MKNISGLSVYKTIIGLALAASSTSAFAHEIGTDPSSKLFIQITDCNSIPRMISEIGSADHTQIILPKSLTSEASLSLVNSESGEVKTAALSNNSFIFSDLNAGNWQLCPSNRQDINFSQVNFITTANNAYDSNTTVALTAAALAIGGGSALLASNDSSNNSSRTTANVQTASATSTVSAVGTNTASPNQRPAPRGIADEPATDCFIGDDDGVDPVSPFS